jgi:membrane-associated protease RseP (regulator of RpoE activity)
MSKSNLIILVVVNFVLTACVGFLAWQINELRGETGRELKQLHNQQVSGSPSDTEIANLKSDLKEQKEALATVTATVATLPQTLKDQLAQEFLRNPSPTLPEKTFEQVQGDDGTISVTGDKKILMDWILRNAVFRDYVFSKSARLTKTADGIQLAGVMPLSLPDQLGLKSGDTILTIDGTAVSDANSLWEKLSSGEDAAISVKRSGQTFTIHVNFAQKKSSDVTTLELTAAQFAEAVDHLHTGLQAVPALVDGKAIGVRLVSVDASNILAALGLRTGDIVTTIAGKDAELAGFADAFNTETWPLVITYLRDDQPVTASFALTP